MEKHGKLGGLMALQCDLQAEQQHPLYDEETQPQYCNEDRLERHDKGSLLLTPICERDRQGPPMQQRP